MKKSAEHWLDDAFLVVGTTCAREAAEQAIIALGLGATPKEAIEIAVTSIERMIDNANTYVANLVLDAPTKRIRPTKRNNNSTRKTNSKATS